MSFFTIESRVNKLPLEENFCLYALGSLPSTSFIQYDFEFNPTKPLPCDSTLHKPYNIKQQRINQENE